MACFVIDNFSSQEIPPTPGQPTKEPTFIPVVVGLLDSSGKDITLSSVYHNGTLQTISSSSTILRVTKVSPEFLKAIRYVTFFNVCSLLYIALHSIPDPVFSISFRTLCFVYVQKEEEFVFSDISEKPVPSLFRGFSAPVRVETDLSDDDLFFLLAHDSDEFNRYVPFSQHISSFFIYA